MSEKGIQNEVRKTRNLKWDKENMKAFSCRVRSYEAMVFKEYCAANDTTPYKVLKNYVLHCIDEYNQKERLIEKWKTV